MTMNLFNAMGLDEETQSTLFHTIKKSSGMKKIKKQNVCSQKALKSLENIQLDIQALKLDQIKQTAALLIQTKFRGYQQRKKYLSTLQNFQKRKIQSYHDLCSKEKDFVMSLATVVSQYIVPLRISSDKHLKKIYNDMHDVFSSTEKILEVHQTLLKTLYELPRSSWPHLNGLGDVFTEISPHWKIYGTYVHNFKFAIKSLEDHIDKNEHFRDFCEKKQQNLTVLLSLPLNHISGYDSHLKNILDATCEDTEEHYSLLQAISITSETSNFIKNSLAQAENLAMIHRLRNEIVSNVDSENLFHVLETEHSKFVMEIMVEFHSSSSTSSKKQYQGTLFLFDNLYFITVHSHKGKMVKHLHFLKELHVEKTSSSSFVLFVIDEDRPSYDNVVESLLLLFFSFSFFSTLKFIFDHFIIRILILSSSVLKGQNLFYLVILLAIYSRNSSISIFQQFSQNLDFEFGNPKLNFIS